jgi:hypothetical protein
VDGARVLHRQRLLHQRGDRAGRVHDGGTRT